MFYFQHDDDCVVVELVGLVVIVRCFVTLGHLVVVVLVQLQHLSFYFLHPSQYKPKSDYGLFMANVTTYTTRAKVAHDDGIDSLAMMSEYVQNPLGGKATAMHNPFWGRR